MVSWVELEMRRRRRTGRNNPEPGLGLVCMYVCVCGTGNPNPEKRIQERQNELGPEVTGRFKQADGLDYHCGSQLLQQQRTQTDALPFQFVCQDNTQGLSVAMLFL